ncbi:hypothetical protein GCM10029992_28220 [Glycomyces albus]
MALGHRRIAFAGPGFAATGVVRQRFEGYREALREAAIPWDETLQNTVETTHDSGREFGRRLAAERSGVSAVVATADILAIGAMEGLAESGLTVPDDVSVIGFDDTEIARYVTPKLTTVAQDLPAKASVTVRLLLDHLLRGETPKRPRPWT